MLIGIDGNEANVKNRVGSNIYSYQLLQALAKLKANVLVYLKNQPLKDMPQKNKHWQYRVIGPKKFWTQLALPLNLYRHQPRPNVFFTPGHYSPRWSPCPTVMSLMDLSYIHFPEMFRKRDLHQLRSWTAYSVRKAKKIFTISQSSQNAIIKEYRVEPEKVVVTYPGLTMTKKSKKIDLKEYGVEGDFLLYVGTLQPRKNLEKLIEAFAQLEDKDLKLVIVGKKGWLYEEIFTKVKQMDLEKRVVFTGFVPNEDLAAFYEKAQCFVLVSFYEGFGLPVLEAMSYGCPVVASKVSSLPEVVGEAGILVDPNKPKEIARGIEKAIKNREELIKKGYQQAKKFSWEKCAQETLKVLEEVGHGAI
ncbi:MAG: glycosyltransferase family 4 protein [Candidatus Marinimicrobia bacterium]|nr:glycosyltransferase family 4 protein [Candidatus Neomarinimicrobiota bacterium]